MSIKRKTAADPISQSADIVSDNIEKLKQLFPSVFTEGNIDFEALKDILGDKVETDPEYYRFTWPGKAMAKAEARKPSRGTLRPAKDESVNWDTTQNLYIEGDNLEVLKLLQKSYANKVKMIYIDPPYNTGKDFVYKDNYKDNLANYNEKFNRTDKDGNLKSSAAETNQEGSAHYHSNWLNMMYPRLSLARNLLTEDGVIFISIDDNEVDNLRKICDEIFGEKNALLGFIWELPRGINAGFISKSHEYILAYCKDIDSLNLFFKEEKSISIERCNKKIDARHPESSITFPAGIPYEGGDKVITGVIEGSEKIRVEGELSFKNGTLSKPVTLHAGWTMKNMIQNWINGKEVLDLKGQKINRFFFKSNGKLYSEKYIQFDSPKSILKGVGDSQTARKELLEYFNSEDIFDYPKPSGIINRLGKYVLDKDDIVLDFFSGSGVTADGIYKINSEDQKMRKYILVQLPEPTEEKSEAYKAGYKTIADIGKERIRRAGKKILEENPEQKDKLDIGFKVFKLDESNIKTWETDPEKLDENLFLEDVIKTDRTEEDVLYEILLKYGLDLTLPIQEKEIDKQKLYAIGGGALLVYLGDNANTEVAQNLINWSKELEAINPQLVFKDNGFNNSQDKVNTLQLLKSNNITDVWSI